METNTDNPSITAGQIELGNNKGSMYTLLNDYDNRKWAKDDLLGWDRGTLVRDIDTTQSDKGYIKATGVGGLSGRGTVNSVLTFTGEFDIRKRLTLPSTPDVVNEQVRIYAYDDASNSIAIFRSLLVAGQTLQGFTDVGNVGLSDAVQPFTDDDIFIRLIRYANNSLEVRYKTDASGDITSNAGWALLHSRAPGFAGDVQVILGVLSGPNVGDNLTLYSDDFYVATGTFTTNHVRTTGYAVSQLQTSPGQPISEIVATLSNGDGSNYFYLDILNSLDVVITSTNNPITATDTLVDADFDNGLGVTGVDWKAQLRSVGDGTQSVAGERLDFEYDGGHGMLLSTHRNRLVGEV